VPLLSSGVLSAALLVRPQIDPRFPDRSRDPPAAGEGRPQREKAGRSWTGPAAAAEGRPQPDRDPLAADLTSPATVAWRSRHAVMSSHYRPCGGPLRARPKGTQPSLREQ